MRFPPPVRRLVLAVHLTLSVGWIGTVMAYLVLVLTAANTRDADTIRSAWIGMDLIGWYAIVPLFVLSVVRGVAMSLGTTWGLLRHYWVVMSLIGTHHLHRGTDRAHGRHTGPDPDGPHRVHRSAARHASRPLPPTGWRHPSDRHPPAEHLQAQRAHPTRLACPGAVDFPSYTLQCRVRALVSSTLVRVSGRRPVARAWACTPSTDRRADLRRRRTSGVSPRLTPVRFCPRRGGRYRVRIARFPRTRTSCTSV